MSINTPLFLAFASFIGMAVLVLRNAREISTGNVQNLRPISIIDLIRPTFEVWKNTIRGIAILLWGAILKVSHAITFNLGKKFLEFAWIVKGKRKLVRDDKVANQLWKDVAYEKERIRAHFVRTEDMVG